MLSKPVFAQMMAMLCEVYDKELTKSLNSTYYFLLQDMEDEDFKQAVKTMMKSRIFATLPKPAEILDCSNVKEIATVEVNEHEEKAKELINLARGINNQIFKDSETMSIPFNVLIDKIKLSEMLDKQDLAVLNTVKPHRDAKLLISNINAYQDGNIQLQAFIDALKYTPSDAVQIGNPIERLRIKR